MAPPSKRPWPIPALAKRANIRVNNGEMYSPTLEEFRKLAAQGNLIPVPRRLLADIETPLSAYRKIRGAGESFLFESVEGGEHIGRYSFVGCNPRAVIRQDREKVQVLENRKVMESFVIAPNGSRPAAT